MNTTNDTATNSATDTGFAQIEAWLVAAGFSFTAVDTCPDARCEVCQAGPVRAAA